ncbi:MAG: DUF3791 domain-containing protein [Clostridium sp.]
MSNEEQKMIDYLVVCVNEFADRVGLSYRDSFNYLNKYNAIKFIKENYKIEHTLSLDDAVSIDGIISSLSFKRL